MKHIPNFLDVSCCFIPIVCVHIFLVSMNTLFSLSPCSLSKHSIITKDSTNKKSVKLAKRIHFIYIYEFHNFTYVFSIIALFNSYFKYKIYLKEKLRTIIRLSFFNFGPYTDKITLRLLERKIPIFLLSTVILQLLLATDP